MQTNQSLFPKVYVLVLNFNGKSTLLNCLRSIYQSDYPNFETVVIDNDSSDGSLEMAKQNFSTAHFIKNPANLGFAAGNNMGIRFALEKFADYVLLLNNDAYLEKNTLSLLIKEAEGFAGLDLVSPLIMGPGKDQLWFSGGKIDWLRLRTSHSEHVPEEKPYASEYITGCAMLIKKTVFKKIGLFDENFFLYYEDADFSLRARQAGFSLGIIPTAKVLHDEQSESGKSDKVYWLVLSGLVFFQKHFPFYLKPWFWLHLTLRRIKNISTIILRRSKLAKEVGRAYRDFSKISA